MSASAGVEDVANVLRQHRVHATEVRFLWLLPITAGEAAFARTRGVDALEDLFERERIDTLDVQRRSVVE